MEKEKITHGLIIVNDILPYSIEVVHVLAAEVNSVCRFRYQIKYIPTIHNYEALISMKITLVLRSRSKATFFPLRRGEIISVKHVGDVIYISVKLLDIAHIDSEYKTIKESIFNNLIKLD
jgi:hypothetical protein